MTDPNILTEPQRQLKLLIAAGAHSGGAGLLAMGYAYRNPYDFVLRHGEWYTMPPWNIDWPRGLTRLCYANSLGNASLRSWTYVEGYALVYGLPMHHAWNLLPDGTPVDTTWQNSAKAGAYLGVPFSLGRADHATWHGDANVLDDWKRRWPLLKKPWKGEDWDRAWEPSPALRAAQDRDLDTITTLLLQ